jgi:ABC-type multidrug transport system ATPase subunit
MSKIIDVKGLTKTFQPSAKVVDRVSFAVEEGEKEPQSVL